MKPISEAWQQFRHELEHWSGELNAELRAYPGPIARCDEQLGGLVEQRRRAALAANLASEIDGCVTRLDELMELLGPDAEMAGAFRERLLGALSRAVDSA
ncbi:MAG TPA: hypothetical protein VFB01_00395 [Burkholderiales bacterium]|nr:hypothetical protein [Burkholderiales bacterium]